MKEDSSTKKTILLVEDDILAAKAVSVMLEKNGYNTLVCHTGLDGVAIALSGKSINLILMDIELGEGIDGAETAKRILAEINIPIVFLASHSEKDYVDKVKHIPRYGFVLKNSGSFILLSSIEMAFNLFEAHVRIQESEEKYRLVFNYSPLGLFHYDQNGIIKTCNNIFIEIIGSSREALIGLNMLKLPDEKMKEAILLSLNGEPGKFEGVYRSVTGSKSTPVRCVFAPLKSRDGQIIGGVGVVEDITESRRALDLLQKSNEELEATNEELVATNEEFEAMNEELIGSSEELQLKEKALIREKNFIEALLNAIPAPVFFKDTELRYIGCNRMFSEVMGVTSEEITGKTAGELWPVNYSDVYDQKDIMLLSDAVHQVYESSVVDKNCQTRDVIFAKDIFYDESGKVAGIVGAFTDITDRKRVEEALKESEEKLSAVFDIANVGISITDANGRYVLFNNFWTDSFGYSSEEMKNLTNIDVTHPEDREKSRELFNGVVEGRSDKYRIEKRYIRKDGSVFWGDLSVSVIRDKNNKVINVVGIIQDITEAKKAELEIKIKNDELSAAMEELEAINEEVISSNQELLIEKYKTEERERNYREIFDSSNDAIFIHEIESREIIDVNKTMLKMYGYNDKQDVVSRIIEDFSAPQQDYSEDEINAAIQKSLESENYTYEWHARKKNGELFWVDVSLKMTQINGENRIMATVRDISKRKLAEDALNESKLLFHLLIESLPQSIYAKDVEGRFVFANENYCTTHHKKLEEIIDKTDFDLHPYELALKYRADDQQVIESGRFIELEEVHETIDGTKFFVQVLKTPFYDLKGQLAGTLGIFWDITERKQAEEILASEKERLSVTLRSIADGVITTDINGNVELLNRAAEELTGWSQDDAKGKPVGNVFNIINEINRKPLVIPVLKNPDSGIFDAKGDLDHTILISKNGSERIVLINGTTIKDRNSSPVGIVMVFRDVTEKRKYEDAAQNAQKLESLGVLAGGIAHDFNNLLSGIFGNIDLARMKNCDNGLNVYFDGAMSAIDRARNLTQQLLTFSRGGTPVIKPGKLSPFIQDIVQFALSGSNVSCRFDIPEGLPLCFYDKNQIGQVIDNLIINAQQAMPMGGVIDVSAEKFIVKETGHALLRTGDYVKISIKDRGIGIPKEIIPFIFDPFFSTKSKGHGLGLATSYSIVSRHGGAIDVESIPGEGSTFNIFLPVSTESPEIAEEVTEVYHCGHGTILVMDDEDMILNVISAMLSESGYSVLRMKDGRDALNYFTEDAGCKHEITAMIFDLTVPGGMGGIGAIKEIRKIDPDIPVFVSSGYSEDPVMANPQDFGFTASIRKPFQISELSGMLEKYVTRKE
jgi:PAS domain S-box-containing protein